MIGDRPVTALVVDDEAPARRGVRLRLERSGGVEVVGECASGREAVEAIRRQAPDVVFLDVQMPGLDGFEVVDAVGAGAMPVTVFVTAYDEHALRAFEAEALDYLLKPIDGERFERAVARAVARVRDRAEVQRPRRFAVRSAGRVRFVDASEVEAVESAGDYVVLNTRSGAHLVRATLQSVAAGLVGFVRVHRSTLVRASSVREVRADGRGGGAVSMADGSRFRVSRSRWSAVCAEVGRASGSAPFGN